MTKASKALLRLRSAMPCPDFRLAVEWNDGRSVTIDFTDALASGPVFEPLRRPELFNKVRIGERARSIEWPEPAGKDGQPRIDIDAEGLLAMALEQRRAERASAA